MSKLVLFMPDGTTLDVPLDRERTAIGRRADNDICLPNLAVSGEHAVVVTILADSFLEDLGSTNGTLVNGKAIAKHFLRDRDHIEIGRHKLVYCVDDAAAMTSEIVGLARINARDFGERVEAARPFVRSRTAPPEVSTELAGAPGTAAADVLATKVAVPAPVGGESAAAPAPPADAPQVVSVPAPPATEASIKVLSGVNAGISIPLLKPETTIGRPGIQVAAIAKAGAAFRLKPIEGAAPPTVNGRPVDRDGIDLTAGDLVEIAGTRLEFVDAAPSSTRDDVAA